MLEQDESSKGRMDYAKESQRSSEPISPCANPVGAPLMPSRAHKRIQELSLELSTLQSRYDELLAVHKRAEARYKKDYSKWRDFKVWLFDEETQHQKNRGKKGMDPFKNATSKEERKKRANARVWKKRQMFLRMGPDMTMFENLPLIDDADKENLHPSVPLNDRNRKSHTPVRERKKRRLNDYMTGSLPSPGRLHSRVNLIPSSPPSLLLSTPTSTVIPPSASLAPSLASAIVSSSRPASSSAAFSPTKASGTFSESQPLNWRHSEGVVVVNDKMGCSSDTEDDSQAPEPVTSSPVSFKTLLPISTPVAQREIRGTNNFGTTTDRESSNPQQHNVVRRISSSGDDCLTVTEGTPHVKDAGKSKAVAVLLPTPSHSHPSTSKHLSDYSAYKGRGRYAQRASASNITINALYTIDPTRNQGRDFQYEEVVRGREERRRMEAGDCECCRDYYEAIGPLPSRLQQPLWRSPTSTPEQACKQRHLSSPSFDADAIDETALERRKEIVFHKQAISRHRHRWTRARTPPGYWDIGFPTTQEALEINQKAREMHRAKREGVEAEAERADGKYRKR